MSDSVIENNSADDLVDEDGLSEIRDIAECVSSDSASTFEYVEREVLPNDNDVIERDGFSPIEAIDQFDNGVNSRPLAKAEKQRQNEEILVMESVSASDNDEKENCKMFLRNERCFSIAPSKPSSSKPCFIDASSLLDDEDLIYTPPPSVCHKAYNAVNLAQLQKSFEAEDDDDNGANCINYAESLPKAQAYEIKDQFSALDRPSRKEYKSQRSNDEGASSRDNEKLQGSLIFQHSIPQFSGHLIKQLNEDNYTSDMSIQSVHSSASGEIKELNDFPSSHYNSLCENTSDYNSGYSRIQSDTDSIVLPETPFNSIVQVARQLKIFEAGEADFEVIDGKLEQSESERSRQVSVPMKIPKRSMKYDEFAPVLSGGASVKDFTPKQCESPNLRRKTDTCPIVSGGSVDMGGGVFEEKSARRKNSTSSQSWIVDFNELKIHESEDRQPKSLDYSGSNQSLGFYVDFNSLNSQQTKQLSTLDAAKKKLETEEKGSKKSTGFYVDFSDSSRPDTPKQVVAEATTYPQKAKEKPKNIFSMFIDFSEDKSDLKKVQPKEKSKKIEQEPPRDSQDDEKERKGCYMFIESDSPVVKRRNLISKNDAKRHSWNVNPQEGPSEAQRSSKNYQRSSSVSNDKGIMNILEKIPVLSKTSSMSIDSSVSPYEDFSCSKSFSSYSNNSVTTSNSSIDQSGTRIPLDENVMGLSVKKRRRDAKLNETFDKSSQGSITEGILSNDDSQASSTDTDDVTFQNNEQEEQLALEMQASDVLSTDFKPKVMETIPEASESSPLKKTAIKSETKIETHTMESLQALIEKQKQILETEAETSSVSFVKLSDLDKPPMVTKQFENNMSNSAGARVSRLFNESGHRSLTLQFETRNNSWNMSRSTGNNFANLASSVENSRSLSRLFPHLSKVISSSVPSHVGLNSDQSFYDHLEFVSSDFSCTSSVTSSHSGMDSADESQISCRQPRRLGEDLLKMFLQEIATDVTLEVSGRKMRAHKVILRSRCQYFAAILAGNWVSVAGNVIPLPGYSYSAVHFALCHIYSGASHPPEGISLMELASLSDLLGLEGLKEVTAYALKTNYCHSFHKPCSGCIDGILQVLPVTLNHGLDELYRKCLKWVCKHFNKVWLTRPFATIPSDVHQRCRQHVSGHLTSENVLYWILQCEDMLKSLEQCRWNITNVENLVRDILDSAHAYVFDHFASLIASDSFLSLGHGDKLTIARLESLLLRTAAQLTPDQCCRSYPRAVRLNQLLTAKVILPNPLSNESLQILDRVNSIQLRQDDQEDGWNDDFIGLVSALLSAVEQCLIRQCSKAMRCSSWQRMDGDLRSKIQKLACLSDTDDLRRLRSSTSSFGSVRNYSASSSVSSRTNDLRQVKLAIQAHTRKIQGGNPIESSNIPVIKKTTVDRPNSHQNFSTNAHPVTKSSTKVHVPEKTKLTHRRSNSEEVSSSSVAKNRLSVKSRYMEPKKPKTPVLDTRANNRAQLKIKNISSSESSTRGSSPAFNRRQIGVRKSSNLSLDSLQSPSKQKLQLALKAKQQNLELSMDSLVDSMRSSMKTEKTVSRESLVVKRERNLTDEIKLKNNGKTKAQDSKKTLESSKLQSNPIRKSFLSQKSREILAKRSHERKHSTNSNSSVTTTKSTIPSPKPNEINKSSSSASLESKKKVFSTTLHLRKTAKLPEPTDLKKSASAKSVPNTKATKSNPTKKSASSAKIIAGAKTEKPLKAPIAKAEDEIMTKMARSSTFSKETSDNPIELLKNIN